ncbi:MAG TPA: amino acid adenylation domain-containing protein, partial [Oceanospirillales bacterium]|nr:amino acid adenylation domain-containing protein [Oceanospirillales bacterium]
LVECVEKLHQRHDALRLRFSQHSGQWQGQHQPLSQQMITDSVVELKLNDFKQLEDKANHYQRSLNLQQGPMFVAIHCRDNSKQQRLVLIIHHLLVDGVSWRILIEDLQTLYQQQRHKQKLSLPAKTSSYQSWGQYLLEYSHSEKLLAQVDYWHKTVSTSIALLAIDKKAGKKSFAQVQFKLDKSTTTQLLGKAQSAYRTQINELLLSALLLAIHRWKGHNSMRIDLESHGRQELSDNIDLSQTVGWFTSIFPLLLNSDDMSPQALICTVKEQYRAVPDQGLGFGLLKYLAKHEKLKDTEPSAILFNYLGQFSDKTDDNNKQQKISMAQEGIGDLVSPLRQPEHGLNFNGSVMNERLSFAVDYQQQLYSKDDITTLLREIKTALKELVAHCTEQGAGCLTPSDFPLAQLSQQQLNQWQNDYAIADIYPATAMQQGLLFHSALDKSAYVTQLLFTLGSGVDIKAFEDAWQQVLNRHSILRTIFITSDAGVLQQLVLKDLKLPWHSEDLSALAKTEQQQQIETQRQADKAQGFDPKKGPLLRFRQWHLGGGQYRILFSDHHALTDGWSMPLLFNQVLEFYYARVNKRTPHMADAVPYRNYVQWLAQQDKNKAQAFWQEELAGIETATYIASKQSVAQIQDIEEKLVIKQQLSAGLQQLAQDSKVTLNTLLQGVWSYVLSRYSNESTVVYGTTVSGRPADLAQVEQMIGLFINTIPVRVDIDPQQSFSQWLLQLHSQQIQRDEYSYLPLVEIQAQSDCSGELIDSIFVFENYPFDELTADEQQLLVSDYQGYEGTTYTLSITAAFSEQLVINFAGKSSHFDAASLAQLSGHFANVLKAVVADPEQKIGQLPLLSKEQQHYLQYSLNATEADYPRAATIQQLFEQQVTETPDNTAVVFADKSLTYKELNRQANQLAHYLIKQGIRPDDIIGLCFERSVDMLVAMLAILKAGAAYLPLDPSYPSGRLSHMIQDSGLQLLITNKKFSRIFKQEQTQIIVDATAFSKKLKTYASDNPELKDLNSSHLAYVIYTSGSTGKPKGVMIEHQALNNLCQWHINAYSVTADKKASHLASIGFDAAVWELWPYLCSGAAIHIISDDTRISPNKLLETFSSENITHAFMPTALLEASFELFDQADTKLEYLLVGGEKLIKNGFTHSKTRLVNHYGPTESTVVATAYVTDAKDRNAPPIGKPIANIRAYVLNKDLSLTPNQSIGELYLAGAGLARGYINQPELTEQSFIHHTFNDGEQQRLYKTGDLVRYCAADGNLEFIGRADEQVKIRGFRIELGEIEAQLHDCEYIQSALVVVYESEDKQKRLIAYVTVDATKVANESALTTMLKTDLKKHLPGYMIPSAFVIVEKFPITANGKIDKKALPIPDAVGLKTQYIKPRGQTQKILAKIWSELLKIPVEQISAHASFLELGGHSLLSIRLLAEIQTQFDKELPIREIFETPQLAELAKLIKGVQSSNIPKITAISRDGEPLPSSFAQQRLWFIDQMDAGSAHYNIPSALHMQGNFKVDMASQAFTAIIQRHE